MRGAAILAHSTVLFLDNFFTPDLHRHLSSNSFIVASSPCDFVFAIGNMWGIVFVLAGIYIYTTQHDGGVRHRIQ